LTQVIVTRRRVHVRTKLPPAKSKASDAEKITAAVALGRELFGLGSERTELAKTARRLGDFAYAVPQPKDQKGFRTCYLIVTDGVSVKYSFVKLNGDPAEIKADRPFAPPLVRRATTRSVVTRFRNIFARSYCWEALMFKTEDGLGMAAPLRLGHCSWTHAAAALG
jgi:hypothetical protein